MESIISGESYYNIFCGLNDDAMDIMKAAEDAGATHSSGNAWVWMGADGFAAADPKAVSPELQTAFQGSVGSNVKMGNDNSTLYIDFLAKWREVHPQSDWPWADSNIIAVNAYTVMKCALSKLKCSKFDSVSSIF